MQQNTHATMQNPAPAETPRIAFRPHPAMPWLVLPSGIALQVLIDAAPVSVPNTRPWFRGVVSQRGNLIPVFDLARWLGYPTDASNDTQIVSIDQGAQACALLCSGSPTLLILMGEASGEVLDGPLAPYVSHAYDSALGKAHEFDVQGWLAAIAAQVASTGE